MLDDVNSSATVDYPGLVVLPLAMDEARSCDLSRPGARFARAERERRGAPAPWLGLDQSRSPALADIIGARRVRTAVMISSGSIPWR